MIKYFIILAIVFLANVNITISADEIVFNPVYFDYLVAENKIDIELENIYFLTYKEKQEIIYNIAREEQVDFWELRKMVNE